MNKPTMTEHRRLMTLAEEILHGTSYGTLRELSFQLKLLVKSDIPISVFTAIIDEVTSGRVKHD